jgi:hypothetical protein
MRKTILIALILALTATSADARRRRHHYKKYERITVEMIAPHTLARSEAASRAAGGLAPPGWQLQPPDPQWNGKRFVSPTGDAWLALYPAPANATTLDQHLKSVAFVDGEEVMFLQRERDRLVVAGHKGDRNFYRKVVLACDGRQWQHVALEYPAEAKRAFTRLIDGVGRALDRQARDCDTRDDDRR